MLKITRKVEYALIALRHMQSKDPEELTSAKEIATHYGIPKQLLAKTLQQMARDNLIEAVQGPTGGYRIRANLGKISLKDFFERLEGPLGMMDCFFDSDCVQIDACNIRVPIQRINDNMRDMFSKMTLMEVTQ
ncbi:MAG: RrF2 family transcriptional regulator [Candidatus Neomarinimicrobiota bacterium]|tara:strand:+ start:849 stop:1247 length:399 start_codon:yes stop_codon:yes gene_type:complete